MLGVVSFRKIYSKTSVTLAKLYTLMESDEGIKLAKRESSSRRKKKVKKIVDSCETSFAKLAHSLLKVHITGPF